MENKTMSTSFQSEVKDFNEEMKLTQNTAYEPVVKTDTSTEEAVYSDLHDYSDYQLPKANVKNTKPPQQPVQYTVGKKSFAAIIILLVIIIFLLVAILVLNLISKDAASSNNAGLTNSGNTAINSNLSLIQDTMNNIIQQIMVHANNTNRSTDELLQLLNTSLIKDISIPTAAAVNDVLLIVNELLEIQNGSSTQTVSCKDIKTAHLNSSSGYYYVNSRKIYCNMGELCGQDGGWTRIAYLDMNDMSQNCPSGLQQLMTGGIRLCRRENSYGGCRSNVFQTNGISYSQICGKVVGYQKGRPNGVVSINKDINDAYIDGVSITRGSPRQHVWSYIAGLSSNWSPSDFPEESTFPPYAKSRSSVNRDMLVVMKSPKVADIFEDVFTNDWNVGTPWEPKPGKC
uniref:Fibrinogen C-terminal domain-containing protein n=1 Tax=Amphimedon queenslandica TaxID=400682 RepID=A0A1X7SX07_AMPQE